VLLHLLFRYFTLHGAVEGLATLVERLFGVTLRATELAPGEGWAPGVRKLTASHPDAGPLGCVYLDLRPRRRKIPGAAHFVIRAGRTGCASAAAPPRLASVALVASLGRDGDDDATARLSHGEVELLFHEAGHALHSLLSDTSYQHMSGTRCAQDVVEAPSTLLERLAWHPAALRSWAKAPGSGEPIPEALVGALRSNRRAFAATECVEQVAHAAMDLALHGAAGPPPATAAEAAALAAATLRTHTPWLSDAANAPFEARSTHLIGYGGTYYAYLYGTALSGAAWAALGLEDDPLARRAGGAILRHLLRPGGSADPVDAFTQLLGPHALRQLGGGWAPDPQAALRDVLRA
jgi:intermediate peptidase